MYSSASCCLKKKVGGLTYTLVPGITEDFPQCPDNCVYRRQDLPDNNYCFKPGGLETECLGKIIF